MTNLIYTFEVKDSTNWNDYGSTHINITATNRHEALKKARATGETIVALTKVFNPMQRCYFYPNIRY